MTTRSKSFCFLSVLILLITSFHLGWQSPYTYMLDLFHLGQPSLVNNIPVNWDSPKGLALVQFFATGNAHVLAMSPNIKIPIYEIVTAIMWHVTHNLFFAFLIVNVSALLLLCWYFCHLMDKYQFSFSAIIITGTLFYTLLWVTHYVAQPIQYTFAFCYTTALFISILLEKDHVVCPWHDGFLLAMLALIYDPYPYIFAFILYALKTKRYHSIQDGLAAIIGFLIPMLCWFGILKCCPTSINNEYLNNFIIPSINAWMNIHDFILSTHVIGTTALVIAFKQILAQIYWPILIMSLYWAIKYRQEWKVMPKHFVMMASCLVVSYCVLQFLTAAFDWDNNPRRAFPVILALFFLLVPGFKVIQKNTTDKCIAGTLAFLGFIYCMADSFFQYFNLAVPLSGEFVRGNSKFPMQAFTSSMHVGFFSGMTTLTNAFSYQNYELTRMQFSLFWCLATVFCLSMITIYLLIIFRHSSVHLASLQRNKTPSLGVN